MIISTAYDDFALKGYELDVIDYLLKPFSFERFLKGVRKVRERVQSSAKPDTLNIRSDGKIYRIPLNEILMVESMGDYVSFHLEDRKLISYETLKHLEEILPGEDFIRVHRSFIVRLKGVDYLEGNQLIVGENSVPVGATYRESVLKHFA